MYSYDSKFAFEIPTITPSKVSNVYFNTVIWHGAPQISMISTSKFKLCHLNITPGNSRFNYVLMYNFQLYNKENKCTSVSLCIIFGSKRFSFVRFAFALLRPRTGRFTLSALFNLTRMTIHKTETWVIVLRALSLNIHSHHMHCPSLNSELVCCFAVERYTASALVAISTSK